MLLAVAKANGLEIELINEQPFEGVSAAYLSLNTLGKIPTFQGEDGFILSETIAISIYRKCSQLNINSHRYSIVCSCTPSAVYRVRFQIAT